MLRMKEITLLNEKVNNMAKYIENVPKRMIAKKKKGPVAPKSPEK